MKPEIIIRNWLMAFFRPEYETEYNTPNKIRPPLDESYYDSFMDQFIDNARDPVFSEKERKRMKNLILSPLQFSTGYPLNAADPPTVGTVYIIESGWQEESNFMGSMRFDGRSQSDITIIGGTGGTNLNMAEPSLVLKAITARLLAGKNYFTSKHLEEPKVSESEYGNDEQRSFSYKAAMRTVTMSYKSERFIPITNFGVLEDG